jgi:hypothetical protein
LQKQSNLRRSKQSLAAIKFPRIDESADLKIGIYKQKLADFHGVAT